MLPPQELGHAFVLVMELCDRDLQSLMKHKFLEQDIKRLIYQLGRCVHVYIWIHVQSVCMDVQYI